MIFFFLLVWIFTVLFKGTFSTSQFFYVYVRIIIILIRQTWNGSFRLPWGVAVCLSMVAMVAVCQHTVYALQYGCYGNSVMLVYWMFCTVDTTLQLFFVQWLIIIAACHTLWHQCSWASVFYTLSWLQSEEVLSALCGCAVGGSALCACEVLSALCNKFVQSVPALSALCNCCFCPKYSLWTAVHSAMWKCFVYSLPWSALCNFCW